MRKDWCSVNIDNDAVPGVEIVTPTLRLRYGIVDFPDGAVNEVIVDLEDRSSGIRHSVRQIDGVWKGYGDGRGTRSAAAITDETSSELTVHLEWSDGAIAEDVTVYRHVPAVRFRYLRYGVNVVDILGPAGAERGTYVAHGAEQWQAQRMANRSSVLREDPNEHNRLTDDLFPTYPNPLYRSTWGPAALDYHGWMIVGLCDDETGAGVGRLMPTETIDVLKLLKGRGFEFFPCFGRDHHAYAGYLFLSTGGGEALLEAGRALADRVGGEE